MNPTPNSNAVSALPIAALTLPDSEVLNARLSKLILGWSETVPDQVSNMPGGQSYFDNKWLSNTRLHEQQQDDIQSIVRFIEHSANQVIKQTSEGNPLSIKSMWCMTSRDGLVGSRHDHAGQLSAAYYVDSGSSGADHGGLLQFFASRESPQPTHHFTPRTGVLFLFPGYLEHSVSAYSGTRPRIVISANLNVTKPDNNT